MKMKRVILAAVLALSPMIASADQHRDPNLFLQAVDLLIVRPVSVGVSSASAALYVATTPGWFVAGELDKGLGLMVDTPMNYTYTRSLGEF